MGYTDQFNSISPCYKDGEQPAGWHMGGVKTKPKKAKTTKSAKGKAPSKKKTGKSKQKGGSTCYASPSVSEMGVHDKPASLEPTASELAWNNRMTGGAFGNNGKPKQASISTSNLFSTNSPVNGSSQVVRNLQANGNSPAVGNLQTNGNSKKNSSLNNIKNNLLPEETISGLVMIVKKTSKNNINSKNDTYSIQFASKRENEKTEIKELGKNKFSFYDISQELRKIMGDVFPQLKPANASVNGTKIGNGTKTGNANASVNGTKIGNGTKTGNANATGLANSSATVNRTKTGTANANATATGLANAKPAVNKTKLK